MSFHFCSHRWDVRDLHDGTLIVLSSRDLGSDTIPVLVDELDDIVLGNGSPNLYLDLTDIRQLSADVLEKLNELRKRRLDRGGRLILTNAAPFVNDSLQAAGLGDTVQDTESAVV